ncbi:hypothetical protein [Pseudomonas sp. BP8]|uniref:hypothetical protein n=1 Tax=Pseudomonas sp. BP8 TaxID=2817864 RepID=UPI001AE805BF|nr:hypothetical protein [Pseudomonas sp. BP8]MBP2264440.1 hypothetical protein [Pseudomonas sp. BP8]HDS1738130.1 hypothetical protein [Pseudomonas putida]
MKRVIQNLALGGSMVLVMGCSVLGKSESFTFIPDLPPDFTFDVTAEYVPATGETCSVPGGRNTHVGFNKIDREYKSSIDIVLYRTVSGCPLMLDLVEITITGVIGRSQKASYTAYHYARVGVYPELDERFKGTFNAAGESEFSGQCQWFFRTIGRKRTITKILTCRNTDTQGNVTKGLPFKAYTLDQLPGKTVRLKIKLAEEEKPGWGDNWVKVPGGWKRCMGERFEDSTAYCNGNYKDFSTFRMLDGRVCTIYPGCIENKDVTP